MCRVSAEPLADEWIRLHKFGQTFLLSDDREKRGHDVAGRPHVLGDVLHGRERLTCTSVGIRKGYGICSGT